MDLEWDTAKKRSNLGKHGVDFQAVNDFDWDTALIADDVRQHYGEPRQIAIGLIGGRLHVCIFTDRRDRRRIISLRKANRREIRFYTGG